jgi:hypothetical protein
VDENYLIMDLVIKGKRMHIGVVYGPNENNVLGFIKKNTGVSGRRRTYFCNWRELQQIRKIQE